MHRFNMDHDNTEGEFSSIENMCHRDFSGAPLSTDYAYSENSIKIRMSTTGCSDEGAWRPIPVVGKDRKGWKLAAIKQTYMLQDNYDVTAWKRCLLRLQPRIILNGEIYLIAENTINDFTVSSEDSNNYAGFYINVITNLYRVDELVVFKEKQITTKTILPGDQYGNVWLRHYRNEFFNHDFISFYYTRGEEIAVEIIFEIMLYAKGKNNMVFMHAIDDRNKKFIIETDMNLFIKRTIPPIYYPFSPDRMVSALDPIYSE